MALSDGSRSRGASGIVAPVVCTLVALVVGVLAGHFLWTGGSVSAAFSGQTTVAEADLDKTIASYTYDGKTVNVTVRDAIESQTSLDAAKNDDESYTLPSADTALSVARNQILAAEAEAHGITVSDEELANYAEQMTGSSDFATIASQYSLTEDQAKEIVRESAALYKLKDEVVSTDSVEVPTAPETPEDGAEDTPNATYGAYIVSLLGDEWDSVNNTWARTDGDYYAAMSGESFSADSATYSQAQMAYYVAYQKYASSASTSSSEWTNYVNGLLSAATIELYTLAS